MRSSIIPLAGVGTFLVVVALSQLAARQGGSMPYQIGSSGKARGVVLRDPKHPCGVACVSVVSRLLGRPATLEEVRGHILPDPLGRNTLAELQTGLRSLGFSTLAVRLGWSNLRDISGPAILHLTEQHYVVAAGFVGQKLLVVDPPQPLRLKSHSELKSWDGIALIVAEDEKKLREIKQKLPLKQVPE